MDTQEEVDFSFWEKGYGRELSDAEKIEIKSSVVGFFTLLIEIDRAQSQVPKEIKPHPPT